VISTHKVDVKYEGKSIRIGVSRTNGCVYFQQIKNNVKGIWFRFDPAYYEDYTEFLKDYYNSDIKENI
jgi:hypothetical protein